MLSWPHHTSNNTIIVFLVARDLYEMLVLYRKKHATRSSTFGIWSEVRVYSANIHKYTVCRRSTVGQVSRQPALDVLKPYYCQTTLVNNPNFAGMLVTLPNIEKMTLSILWLSKFKGHGHQSWLFLALATNFGKFPNLAAVLFLDIFRSYLEELLLIKLSLTLENFIAEFQKVWEILCQTWHEMKKLEKWVTFVASVTHDRSENFRWKNFHIFIMIWQVYHTKFMNGSIFIEKNFDKVCAKTTNFV